MAEQEEPLYDFPEPSQTSRFKGHQRSRGSLRSISVLDRLLLTVPVWLQLSINPATALHILQREPPGTFLVRNSRTSQKKVLCMRLADNSVPSFVQQFDIQEEHSTFSLVTSAISFPDLPRLISFYCVSRDVLPFPLELPEAIARATSHKELESISHMGIDHQTDPDTQPATPPEPQPIKGDSTNTALFKEFCPIKTRSPKELNYGSGIGALCFINPLFLQSLNAWSRRRMFKRSLKVRVSTESSTLLSPPLAPPPPPPLMPKSKSRCKAKDTKADEPIKDTADDVQENNQSCQMNTVDEDYTELPSRTREEFIDALPLPTVMESLVEDADYKQPSPMINASHPLSPYLSPKLPKKSTSLSPRNSPSTSPSVSPYQSPSPSPKMLSPLLPLTSPTCKSPMAEDPYDIPVPSSKPDQLQMPEDKGEVDNLPEGGDKDVLENDLLEQINTVALKDKDSSPLSGQKEAQELHSTVEQNSASS
uniref:SH2 domain-containing protein n=1 Tax=Periophthalmus magnuspinnatus TaxID=409849 RepID=A0A3B4B311_9GOBI